MYVSVCGLLNDCSFVYGAILVDSFNVFSLKLANISANWQPVNAGVAVGRRSWHATCIISDFMCISPFWPNLILVLNLNVIDFCPKLWPELLNLLSLFLNFAFFSYLVACIF